VVDFMLKTGGHSNPAAAAAAAMSPEPGCRTRDRRPLIFLTLAFFWSAALTARGEIPPGFLWAGGAGGGSNAEARAVAIDTTGNVLVTGFFTGTNFIGNTNLVSSGAEDIFTAKFGPAGNFLWARQAGGAGYDEGRGIAADPAGNIYVTGLFQNTAAFGSTNITSSGQSDVFIAKYDPGGNLIWVVGAGGKDFDEAHAIAVDARGNAVITGYFDATAAFGGFSLPNHSSSDDMFVAKCSSTGNFLWAQQAGGSLDDVGNGIALDGGTNVYVTGYFSGTATFGSTNLTAPGSAGLPDIFLARYDPAGNPVWVRQAGGTNDDEANAVAIDAAGNVSLTGKISGTANFGNTNLVGNGVDIFVAQYDAAGNLRWARKAGGGNVIYGDAGFGIATDTGSNVFVTGYFSGTAAFGITNLVSGGFDDVFGSKYDAAGNLLWVRAAGGTDLDIGYGVAAGAQSNVFLAGFFASSTIGFDGMTLTNRGSRNIFIASLGPIIVPALGITATNGNVVLSWPAAAFGFVLESAPTLPATNWTSVSTGTNIIGQSRTATQPMSPSQRFFRLRK
jgi:hypothetical protein